MMPTMRASRILSLIAAVTLVVGAPALPLGQTPLQAQMNAQAGAVPTGLLLRQLEQTGRVLMIAAHPDDEDTSLLATLAREQGVRAAYLALTRGEGGQNLIGRELGEGLGIVRTGELLAARRLDGAEQFFTRAYDFGYSKRAEEALALWPREELLADVVWVVRTFRPHVIVSIFSGTPRDGHGQHQAAGIMAHEAFAAAGDPTRFPEQLTDGVETWAPTKLYRASWFNPDEADIHVPTGTFDPLLGRSPFQVAMASRSQHRSQDMGVAEPLGPSSSNLILVESRVATGGLAGGTRAAAGLNLFAGIDTSLQGLVHEAAEHTDLPARLAQAAEQLAGARAVYSPLDPGASAGPLLVAARTFSDAAAAPAVNTPLARELRRRADLATRAALAAAGVVVDVRVNDDIIVPGQSIRVDVEVWNGGTAPLRAVRPEVALPAGAQARATEPPVRQRRFFGPPPPEPPENTRPFEDHAIGDAEDVAPGTLGRWSFEVLWPETGSPSKQYHLAQPREGAFYDWPTDRSLWAQPRNPELLHARIAAALADAEFATTFTVDYRGVDQAKGEFREPVLVAPRISVAADPATMVWPLDRTDARPVSVTLTNYAPDATSGTVRLDVPAGWTAEPASQPFAFTSEGQSATLAFRIFPGRQAQPGQLRVQAVATDDLGREYRERVAVVDYEHILRTLQFFPAATDVSVFDVQIADNLSVGYVMGSGDAVPAAIQELGLQPELLDAAALESGNLDRFDVIVLGVRAYETREDLIRNNERVLDFARRGGTLIVQYNQYQYPARGVTPWPVAINRPHDRVSVEDAPVTVLDPDAPVLNAPNRITDADFDGWIQERGLYFLSEWGDELQPVLEMADPDEEPKRGSLLVAPLGEGLYVYTGLSFFRQLPAGVPGAYRLFANLVSLRPRGVS